MVESQLSRFVNPPHESASARFGISRKQRREDERAAAVAWLKAKRDAIGLTALAKMLGVDAANLGKMIEGKRKSSKALLAKIAAVRL
jgi:hypothetical protein